MRWFALGLLCLCLVSWYRVTVSDGGLHEVARLEQAVAVQRAENERLSERNRQLAAEVRDLKQGLAALEERARADLGLVAAGEQYYQVSPAASSPAAAPKPALPSLGPPDVVRELPTRTAAR